MQRFAELEAKSRANLLDNQKELEERMEDVETVINEGRGVFSPALGKVVSINVSEFDCLAI